MIEILRSSRRNRSDFGGREFRLRFVIKIPGSLVIEPVLLVHSCPAVVPACARIGVLIGGVDHGIERKSLSGISDREIGVADLEVHEGVLVDRQRVLVEVVENLESAAVPPGRRKRAAVPEPRLEIEGGARVEIAHLSVGLGGLGFVPHLFIALSEEVFGTRPHGVVAGYFHRERVRGGGLVEFGTLPEYPRLKHQALEKYVVLTLRARLREQILDLRQRAKGENDIL